MKVVGFIRVFIVSLALISSVSSLPLAGETNISLAEQQNQAGKAPDLIQLKITKGK